MVLQVHHKYRMMVGESGRKGKELKFEDTIIQMKDK